MKKPQHIKLVDGNTATQARPLVDPLKAYIKPPFQAQEQPWPGLSRRMIPPPDQGETSYRGSNRLVGRKALITGGDSGMGAAAAIAFAREGADVAINYFPNEEDDARDIAEHIRQAGRNAVLIPGICETRRSAKNWSQRQSLI